MAYDINQILNFQQILVTELAGSVIIFIFLAHILVLYLAAMFRFENKSLLLYMALLNLIFAATLTKLTLVLVIFFIAIYYAPIIKRIFER